MADRPSIRPPGHALAAMNPYASLGRYGDVDVMQQMVEAGYTPAHEEGGLVPTTQFDYSNFARPNHKHDYGMPGQDFAFAGQNYNSYGVPFQAAQAAQRSGGGFQQPFAQGWRGQAHMAGEEVEHRYEHPQVVDQRLAGVDRLYGFKPYVMTEKIVEVPETIVKSHSRHIPKPEIVERVIEVPKIGYNERHRVGPARTEFVEDIVEVPRGVTEVREKHVPKLEIQERLIEVPRLEFREIIEYEDRVEYREVPVDKIIEVPEIEYRVREVEKFVPQTYVQEYYIDHYEEVPIVQVQEVERFEHVPIINAPRNNPYSPNMRPSVGPPPMGSGLPPVVHPPMPGPSFPPGPSLAPRSLGPPDSARNISDMYAKYDPLGLSGRPGMMPPNQMVPPNPLQSMQVAPMPMGSGPMMPPNPLRSMELGAPALGSGALGSDMMPPSPLRSMNL